MAEEDMWRSEVVKEGEDTVLRIDAEKVGFVPSIEDSEVCMAKTFENLIKNPNVTKIQFLQKRDYEYDYTQTRMLAEMAQIYNQLIKQKDVYSYDALKTAGAPEPLLNQHFNELHQILFNLLKKDPIGAYVELDRLRRREEIKLQHAVTPQEEALTKKYISVIKYIGGILHNTKFIQKAHTFLAGYKIGNREIYRKFFAPTIKPDFMFTKLMASYPKGGEEIDNYNLGGIEVVIFRLKDSIQTVYHVMPPEFKLTEEKYELLDLARNIMAEHKPEKQEFVDPERMREVFFNVGADLIEELANYKNFKMTKEEVEELTKILVRYTVGFGFIEVLMEDPKVQDITLNAPMGQQPINLVHGDYDECRTNIIPSVADAESWASKLRMISGRPLDEANPILDTEISIPNVANARIGVIGPPLNPYGLGYAFRRHRDKPWTLPLFLKTRMISPLAAGLISFLVDGNRTMLVAGTRSAGKTSLLGAVLMEIMRKYRVITVEDTLELPTTSMRKLGYNVQPMKVASALSKGGSEVPADEGIRTTLRLGDSALIVGEVRSTEARALYEAMRVGALANVVAGTIHGDSPYGVYDRVVNDLDVPKTSFKATDIVIVANPIRSPDGLHRWRRVTQITEVRKTWEDDPLTEHGFVDIMKYNSKTDQLEPTDDFINGDIDVLKAIAGNVKEWAGNWDAIWDNIQLRAKVKEEIFKVAEREKNDDLLEAEFVIRCNDAFHNVSEKVLSKMGHLDSKEIFFEWKEWLEKAVIREKLKQKELEAFAQ